MRCLALNASFEPLTIESLLPFLEAFLPEAEQAWSGDGAGRADSCLWTQVTTSGEELHLEATALRVGASQLLVITRNHRTRTRVAAKLRHLLQS